MTPPRTPVSASSLIQALFRARKTVDPTLFAVAFVVLYLLWSAAFRLLVLTLVTYFISTSSQSTGIHEIADAFASSELPLSGFSALLFVLLLRGLNPLTATTTREIFTPQRFRGFFVPGFLQGTVVASGVSVAFVLSGSYRYLGFPTDLAEAPWEIVGIAFRAFALATMVYCEEFIFRHKILGHLKRALPLHAAAVMTILLYTAIKAIQFHLGVMHLFTVALLSCAMTLRTLADQDFGRGAGFLSGLLVVFHAVLSLPVLGSDFAGLLLLKYQLFQQGGVESTTARLVTGGAGGPLSSFALQLLLVLYLARDFLSRRRLPMPPAPLA